MSVKMEMDVSGSSRAAVSVLPAAPAAGEAQASLKHQGERPRCSSTPCSPIKTTLSGYQIVHMDSHYLVGFTTGEELLKLATKWSATPTTTPGATPGGSAREKTPEATPSPLPSHAPRPADLGVHRASRIFKAKSRYYQPYDIPAANGRRRRRMPSSGEPYLRSLIQGEAGSRVALHGALPLCLLKGKRAQSKSLDYLNLDKMSVREPADTEVLQHQLQHLTLRGDRMFNRNKT
ncbi:macrophage immunometabolism regulator [Aplochiton taeniatus]